MSSSIKTDELAHFLLDEYQCFALPPSSLECKIPSWSPLNTASRYSSSCPSKLFFLHPAPKLRLGRFFNEGGMGGSAGGLSLGWTGVKDDVEEEDDEDGEISE